MFKYTNPILQISLNDNGHYEYHITITNNKFHQEYYDNTNEYFLSVVSKYIKCKWSNELLTLQIDHQNDDSSRPYIWIHIKIQDHKITIKNIIDDLNEKYNNEWKIHSVPKLMTCICKKLSGSERFFAESLCEYQDTHGKNKTKEFLHTYFQDIKRTQIIRRRNMYDFDDSD